MGWTLVRPGSSTRGGWTLLELIISAFVLTVVSLGLASSLKGSLGVYSETQIDLILERRLDRALQRVQREVRNAGAATLDPVPVTFPGGPTGWVDNLRMQRVEGWNNTGPILETDSIRFELLLEDGETDDGTDEDGDGLVDEHRLMLTMGFGGANPRTFVLASGVLERFPGETLDGTDENGNGLEDEPGACFAFDGTALTFYLAIGSASTGTVKARSRSVRIVLTN